MTIRMDNENIPYESRSVTFIRLAKDGSIDASHTLCEKRAWIQDGDVRLYAAWNGQRRTDIFTVNLDRARTALGAQ